MSDPCEKCARLEPLIHFVREGELFRYCERCYDEARDA